ncbi:preprotein translocase subunit SecE [Fundicoccus culcitae]|uniref:Protein translocase subunit SecE n=1 Tax=Fundicoccus culcitae TaxID=2969821 RepID=A0ABY5P3F1_9LACT|nr:preprotein translocase subunit SecE [Fundicoccus culcitae]UUX33035.1 preprotein translocase subunit SecE [Fundicoccus culcitae]
MNYIKNVAKEMKNVTWPSVKEVNRFTLTVIVMVIVFALYFALTDFASSEFIAWLINL